MIDIEELAKEFIQNYTDKSGKGDNFNFIDMHIAFQRGAIEMRKRLESKINGSHVFDKERSRWP